MAGRRNQPYRLKDAFPHLKNPKKYKGPRPITLRSGLEINWVMKFLDLHSSVLEWSSENVIVPYFYPIDRKRHRYFVDFWMKVRESDGSIKEYLIEIKPKSQTVPPKIPKRKTRSYMNEVATYVKNQSKWQAAEEYAGRNDMTFKVITEGDIPH